MTMGASQIPSIRVVANTAGPRGARGLRRGASLRAGGFSLFELLIVVSLFAIVAAMAVPRYASSVGRYRADAAARRVAADLALARAKARAVSAERTVTFNAAAGAYTISGMRHLDRASDPYTVNLSEAPYHVLVAHADFGGVPQARFDMFGEAAFGGVVRVRSGDYERTVTLVKQDGSITVN